MIQQLSNSTNLALYDYFPLGRLKPVLVLVVEKLNTKLIAILKCYQNDMVDLIKEPQVECFKINVRNRRAEPI